MSVTSTMSSSLRKGVAMSPAGCRKMSGRLFPLIHLQHHRQSQGEAYHHRGAHLNAINNVLSWELPKYPVYLWTLPMFHCNGWCFPWTLTATAGASICLRHVLAVVIYEALHEHKVSHFCAAPIVLNMLNNADPALKQGLDTPSR